LVDIGGRSSSTRATGFGCCPRCPWGGAKVDIIQSGRYPFEKRHTYALPLERAERAIHMLAAHGKGVNPVHLAVVPGAPKVNV